MSPISKRRPAHCTFRSCHVLLQGYWQSAIAARPSAAHTGYLLGGVMWFCIPFTLATTMGLAALALDLPITLEESGSGEWPDQTPLILYAPACKQPVP